MFLYKILGLLEQEDAFHHCFNPGRFYTPSGLCLETQAECKTISFSSWSEDASPGRASALIWVSHSFTSIWKIFSFIL